MTARWCRLTQPENTSKKKVSGGGNGGMAGVWLRGGLRSTGNGIRHLADTLGWEADIPEAKAPAEGG